MILLRNARKMIIIRNKILPFGKNYYAINLFGVLFAKGPCSDRVLNHEKIHTRQMVEMAFLPFYLWYVAEWLVRLLKCRNSRRAYRSISFEREAYATDGDPDYLSGRPRYSWIRYLKRESPKIKKK